MDVTTLPFNDFISFTKNLFTAGIIGSARLIGLALFFPLFSRAGVQGLIKNGLMVGLSVPNIALVYHQLDGGAALPVVTTSTLILKEVMVGALMGLLLGLPFFAAQISGDVIDAFRGASNSNLVDPINASENSISGTFFVLYSLGLFIVIGGMPLLMDMVFQSQTLWPSLKTMPNINRDALVALADLALKALYLSFLLAAPLLIAMALADIALVFKARVGQSIQIQDLATPLHNLIFTFLMPVVALLFAEHFPTVLRDMFRSISLIMPAVVR